MEKTWDSIKKYKKEFILGPIFKIVEVVFELMIPFLMKYMINTIIKYIIHILRIVETLETKYFSI